MDRRLRCSPSPALVEPLACSATIQESTIKRRYDSRNAALGSDYPMVCCRRRGGFSVKHATGADPRNIKGAARQAAHEVGAAASDQVRNLIADIEALVERVGEAADPEVRRLRTNVSAALGKTKKAIADGAEQLQDQAEEAIDDADRYVRS